MAQQKIPVWIPPLIEHGTMEQDKESRLAYNRHMAGDNTALLACFCRYVKASVFPPAWVLHGMSEIISSCLENPKDNKLHKVFGLKAKPGTKEGKIKKEVVKWGHYLRYHFGLSTSTKNKRNHIKTIYDYLPYLLVEGEGNKLHIEVQTLEEYYKEGRKKFSIKKFAEFIGYGMYAFDKSILTNFPEGERQQLMTLQKKG